MVAQWTENGMTDLLAAPDGGLIKWMKDRINVLVEKHRSEQRGGQLDSGHDNSKSIRPVVTVNAVGQAWRELREKSDFFFKVGVRTGNVFKLKSSRVHQFSGVNLRGYVNQDRSPKNPFQDKTFEEAFKQQKMR